MNLGFLTIVIVIGLPVVCGTLIVLATIFKSGSAARNKQLDAEETRLLQELHHGLAKMEKRIEALETLLIEQDKSSHREPTNLS